MPLFALDPWWNDFFTVAGFLVGAVGFYVTIRQVVQTKRVVEAAADAAGKTLAENKESYERFVGAFASRLLSELQRAVNSQDWRLAEVRAHDLAELLGALPATGNRALDDGTAGAVESSRDFAQTFAEPPAAKRPVLPATVLKERWKPLLQLLHRRLDHLRAPFRERTDGQVGSDNPAGQVPGDRSEPARENGGGTGELGPDTVPRADD